MEKYKSLIFGALLTVAAIIVIVWIMRENQGAIDDATANTQTSPDEDGVEPLNGLAPNNAVVEVAQSNLTYNVPQPGNVAPIDTNQDYLTKGQALVSASDSADDVLRNLLAVNLPPSDYVN